MGSDAAATIGAATEVWARPYPGLAVRDDGAHGRKPAFSTPITVHRFVGGVGYVRALGRGDFSPIFFLETDASWCARRPRVLAPRPSSKSC